MTRLASAGVDAYALDLASVGDAEQLGDLHDDVQRVRAVLDRLEAPVVLCGHSYAGAVVTEAAAGPHPAVTHLVYLAAVVPSAGDSLASMASAAQHGSPSAGESSEEQVVVHDDGTGELLPESARAALFVDCDPDRAEEAVGQLRRFNLAVSGQRVGAAAWLTIPATLVRGAVDVLPVPVAQGFLELSDYSGGRDADGAPPAVEQTRSRCCIASGSRRREPCVMRKPRQRRGASDPRDWPGAAQLARRRARARRRRAARGRPMKPWRSPGPIQR